MLKGRKGWSSLVQEFSEGRTSCAGNEFFYLVGHIGQHLVSCGAAFKDESGHP